MTAVRLHYCRFHQSARALSASRNRPSTYSPTRNYADPLDALHGVPASLHLLARSNAAILTCPTAAVQHRLPDASAEAGDCRDANQSSYGSPSKRLTSQDCGPIMSRQRHPAGASLRLLAYQESEPSTDAPAGAREAGESLESSS